MKPSRCVCGGTGELYHFAHKTWCMMCDSECSCSTPNFKTKSQAIRVWNAMQREAKKGRK